ncbi:MAG: MFS transporter [Cyclobacteriaceae bacterium]|nr:MFS transporter [Cyclobacteriaceae bacterium]
MSSPYAALHIRDFRLFISARFCVTLAINIQAVVVGWQVYEITKDPLSLGLIGLAEAIPSIVVSLYAGHLADIIQRKQIIVVTLATLFLCSLALLSFTSDLGGFILNYGIWPIYAVIFVSGIARGFITPALFSFMPQLVPRELYQNAISWNSTLWEMASIGGPPIGGLIYGFFGISAAYSMDVALMLIGLSMAMMVPNKPLPPMTEEQGIADKIKAGLKFVFQNKIIFNAISLDLFAVLFGGAIALLPIFADQILGVGKVGLGFLRSAPGIGAVLTAVYLTHYPIKKSMGKILLFAVGGFGVCMILFAVSTNFWISMGVLAISGAFDCVSVIVRGTLLQTLTPENMKGRVSAVNNIFIGSSNEIGAFESGIAARVMKVVPSVIFGGVMTLLVVGLTAWKAPAIRKLENVN